MAQPSPASKVLRVAVVVDDVVCDELHQEQAGAIHVGADVGNTITLHGKQLTKSSRALAPVWLAAGAVLVLGGAGWFISQLAIEMQLVAEATVTNRFAMPAPHDGTGGFAVLAVLFGMFPLLHGLYGIRDQPRQMVGGGLEIPDHHRMFDYRGGRYFLDLPETVRGKISLGSKTYTVSQLRKKFGARNNLRLQLSTEAKGKLLLGETTVLFQFARPKPAPEKALFPVEFRPRLEHMVTREEAASLASAALVLGTYFTWAAYAEVDDSFSVEDIDERFLQVMGIKVEKEDEVVEEQEEEMLAQDEEKDVTKDEKEKPEPKEKPEKFSEQAMKQARGVGVARVLGTYGGDGPGTVFDVIADTENSLGELFAQGMTTTVLADGGDISAFVPGGEGITAHGAMAGNQGLDTGEGPELVNNDGKQEKKIRGTLKNTGTDVFGDVDKKAVQATIRRRMSALQHCYEKALRTQPSLQGKMTYSIEISVMGSVTRVSIEEDTIGSPAVTACTKGKIKGWRFPTAGAEESSEVTFSVVFSGGA